MSETTSLSYQYSSLKELRSDTIRLLTILPGSVQDPIACNLSNASLSAKPDYAALSYVWGPVDQGYEISLGGKSFRVRENLQQCLLHLRHPHLSICFWIDAICVNQGDLEERRQQVALMGAIYSSAVVVVSWLGAKPAQTSEWLKNVLDWQMSQWSELSFTHAELQSNSVQALVRTGGLDHSPTASELLQTQWAELATPELCSTKFERDQRDLTQLFEAWTYTLDLFSRPYWSRLWILQEVLLAKKLLLCFGSQSLPASSFRSLHDAFLHVRTEQRVGRLKSEFSEAEMDAEGFNRDRAFGNSTHSILYWLPTSPEDALERVPLDRLCHLYQGQQCADVRDRIYGFLSLADDCDELEADYTICCTDLFWRVLRRKNNDFTVFDLDHFMRTLSITLTSLRTESKGNLSDDCCSVPVRQWALVTNVLFTRSFRQVLSSGVLELQCHNFVLLTTNDLQTEPLLALVISREPATTKDVVFVVESSPFYLVLREQASKLVLMGRAFPLSHGFAPDLQAEQTMDHAHEATFGIPQAPIEVGKAVEAERSIEYSSAEIGSLGHEHCKVMVSRSLILEMCAFRDRYDRSNTRRI